MISIRRKIAAGVATAVVALGASVAAIGATNTPASANTAASANAAVICTVVAPRVGLRVAPDTGTAPLAVHVNVTLYAGTKPISYAYSYGDGSGLTGSTVHTYTKPGTYTVRVTARNTAGTGTATDTVTVKAAPAPPPPSPSPSPSQSSPPPPPPSGDPMPNGIPGTWKLAFDDEFNGTALDTNRWVAADQASVNNVTTSKANVSVGGGTVNLTLASSTSGALLSSSPTLQGINNNGAAANGFELMPGDAVEARVYFPGNGSQIYNWPAFWASGDQWPTSGEIDIAEGLGELTTNYHGTTNGQNGPAPSGTWSNAFHTYAVVRHASSDDVYWDGRLVWSHATGDNGQPEALLVNVGYSGDNQTVFGAASTVKVDYIRAWTPG